MAPTTSNGAEPRCTGEIQECTPDSCRAFQQRTEPPSNSEADLQKGCQCAGKVNQLMRENGPGPSALKTKLLAKLFDEAEKRPGGLDRFLHQVERDHERYSKEMKEFRRKLEEFDRDHGLLPREGGAVDSHNYALTLRACRKI